MRATDYRSRGVGLVRASAQTFTPTRWPQIDDVYDCRTWLEEIWPEVAAAVQHASPSLAHAAETVLAGVRDRDRDVRRVVLAVLRYVLRFGRSTPFGLFAGVGTVSTRPTAWVRVGQRHRAVLRPDCGWLRGVIDNLESCPVLLTQLSVVFNDGVVQQDGRLWLPRAEVVSIRCTRAVSFVRKQAAGPVRFTLLLQTLTAAFPDAGDPTSMVQSLLQKGFLISNLRAPSTVTDPLGHVVSALRELDIERTPAAEVRDELVALHESLRGRDDEPNRRRRIRIHRRMQALQSAPRGALSLDLRLDVGVHLPTRVVQDMEQVAGVLARLVREHTGRRPWRDYFAAFCDRYGTGTLVPLRAMLDTSSGLGWPQGYPSGRPADERHVFSPRDRLLLRWALEATMQAEREIVLDDDAVEALASAGGDPATIPPHVDLGARIHAPNAAALDHGDYQFTVVPGRAAGTLTSRFTIVVPEAGVDGVLAELPPTVEGATVAQLSFTPPYANAENISRTPRYLAQSISVGEHHKNSDQLIDIEDLAVTADRGRLHLVSLCRRRVIEPVVLHALAAKQQPPLARLLGELPRALTSDWIGFDWGPVVDTMPFRPRVRYGRAILSPACWRLPRTSVRLDQANWDDELGRWQSTWRCPQRVALQDFDQQLPVDLSVPAHRELLRRHLRQHDEAVLVETADPGMDGWIDGRAHLVVLPLVSQRAPSRGPNVRDMPVLARDHGQPPGSRLARWLYAKLYLDEHRTDAFLIDQLPSLLAELGERPWWFVRYPRTRDGDEPDHLRLRVRTDDDPDGTFAVVTAWIDQLRTERLLSRSAFDTYYPEIGRYRAIAEAEAVFAADSRYVLAWLAGDTQLSTAAATGLSLFDLATAFLGGQEQAARWLHRQALPAVPDRTDVDHVTRVARNRDWPSSALPTPVATALRDRADAVRRYRQALPGDADLDACLHALLHMHHNRALGVDPAREAACLRLARQAGATWRTTTSQRCP